MHHAEEERARLQHAAAPDDPRATQQAQPVPLLDLLNQLVDRALLAHAVEQVLDEILVAVEVKELAHDRRRLLRAHLLHVDFHVLQ